MKKRSMLLVCLLSASAGCGSGAGGFAPVPDTSDEELRLQCPPFLRAKCPIPEVFEGKAVVLYSAPTFHRQAGARDTSWVRAVPVAAVVGEGRGRRWQRYTCEELVGAPPNVLGIQCADTAQGWSTVDGGFDGHWTVAPLQR